MNKNKFSGYFVFISLMTLIAVFFVLVQKSYSNLVKPTAEMETSVLAEPFDPNLDLEVITEIEQHEELSLDETPLILPTNSPVPTPK
ncbi:MAG: hypothetical protein WC596_01460 [Candidatus Shapirobacteria bacterium]